MGIFTKTLEKFHNDLVKDGYSGHFRIKLNKDDFIKYLTEVNDAYIYILRKNMKKICSQK